MTTIDNYTPTTQSGSPEHYPTSTTQPSHQTSTHLLTGFTHSKATWKDSWIIQLSKNWRIVFRFGEGGHVRNVNLIDYH